LFALALHFDLEEFKGIKSHLVLHSSGVTMRKPELELYWPEIPILKVDDFAFKEEESHSSFISTKFSKLKRTPRIALSKIGLIAYCNTDSEFKRIRPYVKQFRGHYSNRSITPRVVRTLSDTSAKHSGALISDSNFYSRFITLHYRLGDLLTLNSKKPLSSERVSQLLRDLAGVENIEGVNISSDSPDLVMEKVVNRDLSACKLIAGDSFQTIQHMQEGYIFIGTNSKISLWVTLIRIHFQHHKTSWMPREMMGHLENNIEGSLLQKHVRFY
jgi:hypothetical protein